MVTRRGMKQSLKTAIALIVMTLSLAACTQAVRNFFRGYAETRASALSNYDSTQLTPQQRGAVAFTLSDFGALNTDALETHAVPWRLAATALVLRDARLHGGEISRARIRPIMTRFGFLYPDSIANWPANVPAPQANLGAPQGMSLGVVRRSVPPIELTTANLSCASCHAGHAFSADGMPQITTSWLGTPNTSLDLELYVREVYAAVKELGDDKTRIVDAITRVFPDTSRGELNTIRDFVLPRLSARVAALEASGDRPLPFVNGAPGLTNGVAALRMQFHLLGDDAYASARGFTSIPDLGSRGFRTALLYDAAYVAPGDGPMRTMHAPDITQAHLDRLAAMTAFFTVPSMGVNPSQARDHIGEARDIYAFLRNYAPQRFPGHIDARLAARGHDLYAQRCSSCHGAYDDSLTQPQLQSFPNWIGAFDTDRARAQVFTSATASAVNASAYGANIEARATGEYAAPLLSGLWMTAPYLHNGSVPTLWHLMHPGQRPTRFQVGGHRLTYDRVGIDGALNRNGDYVYPESYRPWSMPSLIDTRAPGLGNQGHVAPFNDMSEAEKHALLEYLKLL